MAVVDRGGRDRVCTARPRLARRRAERRSWGERVLIGTAVALCSAVVVVVLGLVADLAAASHAGEHAGEHVGPRTTQVVEQVVPAVPGR